jgi:hypothetical protein
MFALRRAAIKAAPLAARSTIRPFSVLGARFCKYYFHFSTLFDIFFFFFFSVWGIRRKFVVI